MRLTQDQIRQGILHSDVDVRFACLRYFAEGNDRNTTIMPVVIDALERHGRTRAFRSFYPIARLPQTPETIQWVVRELQRVPGPTKDDEKFSEALTWIVRCADPRLVQPHVATILTAPAFVQSHAEPMRFRAEILDWSSTALWNELERICEEGKAQSLTVFPYDRGIDVVEALARHGEQIVESMTPLLSIRSDGFERTSMTWLEPFVIRLTGELKHEPSIPVILDKLRQDADLVNEEGRIALGRIGSETVVEAIRDGYPSADWCFRLYTAGALGHIHSDLAVQTAIELLEDEDDPDLRDTISQSLVGQFSTEGNEAARRVFLDIPEACCFQTDLVAACTLMGQDFPELEDWRRQIESKRRLAYLDGDTSDGKFKSNGSTPH